MACTAPLFLTAHSFGQSPCHGAQHRLSPAARPFRPSPPPSRVVLVRWTPPPRGWFKVNFDGSVYNDGSRRASIGGVIRDCAGRVVLAFAEQTEHSTVGIVEARALIRGLQLARELGLERVVAEGDDLVLVQLLRGEETQTRIPVAVQEEILELMRNFPGRDVRHIYREGNQVAHTLCRQSYHGPGVWIGGRMPLPSAVWEKIEEDIARCAETIKLVGDAVRRRQELSVDREAPCNGRLVGLGNKAIGASVLTGSRRMGPIGGVGP